MSESRRFNRLKIGSGIRLFLWLLSSWILVHFFAVFGIFVALAYPIWWLFVPSRTVCLVGRFKKVGETCPLCKKVISSENDHIPSNAKSIFVNSLLIVLLTVFSFGLVFLEHRLLNASGVPLTRKTASVIIPERGQYRLGEIFPMRIEIENIENAINAVQADIGFDPERVEVVDIRTDESFASVFIQKEIDNDGGWARLMGGLPSPGYSDPKGTFGTIYFMGISPGIVKVEFLASSKVLANDKKGTNILKELPSAAYLILPERISAKEEELQKNLLSHSNVLGDSSDKTKMTFYEEDRVLGITSYERFVSEFPVEAEVEAEEPQQVGLFFVWLEKIDSFIIDSFINNIWCCLAERLFSLFTR